MRTVLAAVAAAAIAGGVVTAPAAVAAPPAAAHPVRTGYAVVGHAPRIPAGAIRQAAPAAASVVTGSVALKPRDPAALTAAATAVSDPRSPSYRHFLPRGAFAATYGPTPATLAAVESSLRADHLSVTSVSRSGMLVHFRGTATTVQSAFRTRLARYRLPGGRIGTETTSAPSLPAAVAGQVEGVLGLDTLAGASPGHLRRPTHPATRKARSHPFAHTGGAASPCPEATGAANLFGGLTDDQIANSYGATGLYRQGDLGRGQTIGIYELEPFSRSDLSAFDSCYFGARKAANMAKRVSVVRVDGGSGSGPGSGESILDVQDVSALAPDANIEVYEAPNSSSGGMDEYTKMIDRDTATIISSSWGFCESDEIALEPGYVNVENDVFQQAALQGQTVLNASGDSGADACAENQPAPADPQLSVGDPASQPFVVGVGGTAITDARNRPTEQVWNDGSSGGGSGGGVSAIWGAPSWQVPALSSTDRASLAQAYADGAPKCANATGSDPGLCRQVPDISAQADEYTGAVTIYIGVYGGWTTIGGTSSSTPLVAAMLALVAASQPCQGGSGLGFISPLLYQVAAGHHAAAYNDVTAGNNDSFDLTAQRDFRALPGYDMATGLGTPRLTGPKEQAGLSAYLCAAAGPAEHPSISGVAPAAVPVHPGSGHLTVTGSGFTGARAVSIGTYDVPADAFSVVSDTQLRIDDVPAAAQTGNQGPQDGSGRVIVSVTGADGASSVPTAASSFLYVQTDGSGNTVPSVTGLVPYGGSKGGGNTVTVYGSGFGASGGDPVTAVTIGGRPVESYTVVSDTQLRVRPAPYSSGVTTCASGDDPQHDVCQAQLVVSNANGSSHTATIAPPYTGAPYGGAPSGPLPDCVTNGSCEIVPATSEYDYFAFPTISHISPAWVSENGDSIATIDGSGFDYLGLEWVDVGDPGKAANQDYSFVDVSPTQLQIVVNGHNPTVHALQVAIDVQTMAGRSAPSQVTYAGFPVLSSVSPQAGPDTGGTHIALTGRGFEGSSSADGGAILYSSESNPFGSVQTTGYSVSSDTAISATTPQMNPDTATVQVCTVSGCSEPTSRRNFDATSFTFFQPGDPVVDSVSAKRGPAHGGTRVVIRGHNLANVVSVRFGSRSAAAHNAEQLSSSGGSSYRIIATAPPGPAGRTVNIRVVTIESEYGGKPSPPTRAARFTWTASSPSAPRQVRERLHGLSAVVHWRPPTVNGGAPVTGYRVIAHAVPQRGHKTPATVVTTTGRGGRHARLHGLRGGWYYRFEVRAVNRRGTGPAGNGRPGRVLVVAPA